MTNKIKQNLVNSESKKLTRNESAKGSNLQRNNSQSKPKLSRDKSETGTKSERKLPTEEKKKSPTNVLKMIDSLSEEVFKSSH